MVDVVKSVWEAVMLFARGHGLDVIFMLMLAQFCLGVAVAVRDGVYEWKKLSDIIAKTLPNLIAFLVVDMVLNNDELTAMVLALIVASLTASVTKNLSDLFPAIKDRLPASLK